MYQIPECKISLVATIARISLNNFTIYSFTIFLTFLITFHQTTVFLTKFFECKMCCLTQLVNLLKGVGIHNY